MPRLSQRLALSCLGRAVAPWALATLVVSVGCASEGAPEPGLGDDSTDDSERPEPPDNSGPVPSPSEPVPGSGGSPNMGPPSVTGPMPTVPGEQPPAPTGPESSAGDPSSPVLPARIRRLTNAEYDASVHALLGTALSPSVEFSFPPDTRQGPTNSPAGPAFTVNDAQRVDPVLALRLDAAALALVAEARGNGRLAELAPCADPQGAGEQCARDFLASFGARAFRRGLSDAEVSSLVLSPTSPYHVGADGYSYEEGIDAVTRALLQSPGFLYITELGEGEAPTSRLTGDEIATQLAYLLTGAPPDASLLEQASAGALETAEGRETEARRLLASDAGRARLVRVVREWLGIDDVARREKSTTVYPAFGDLSSSMEAESHAFIDEVLSRSTGTLTELLTADWTIVDERLAQFYGVTWGGEGQRTSLQTVQRRGILNQGAFLSVFASNNGSHPVFRGVAIMRRIACLATPDPGALGIVVSFPASDPSKTTRQRFAAHAEAPGCDGCHTLIDALGFTFENFDGIGQTRTEENGLPVDTSAMLASGTDFDGTFADSTQLLSALANSDEVKTCLARRIFHSAAARSNETIAGAEAAFLEVWNQMPEENQDRLIDVLLAYVTSASFIERTTL